MENHKSILNKSIALWLLTLMVSFSLTACNNNQVDYPEGSIIMTTTAKEVTLRLSGSDDIQIHWGDGKKSNLNEGLLLDFSGGFKFSHTYSSAAKRNIYITGKVEILDCTNNQLTNLDVSQNPELKILYCFENRLTELDVSKNTLLEELRVSDNQISTLDVSQNNVLKDLRCSNNLITNIDVSANSSLIVLNLDRNQLTELDVSKNTLLLQICVEANQLVTSELNDLFKAMRYIPEGEYAFIDYTGNPGSDDADHSIWQEKNWLLQSCR